MSFLPNSRCALQATHLLALNPWLHRWDGLGVSRTAFLRQGGAPISYAAGDRRRVQHIVRSTMARLASAISHHSPTR